MLVECVFLVVDMEHTHRTYDANLLRPLGGPLILSNKNKQCANSFWLSQCPRKHHPCCSRPDQCFLIRQPRPTEKPATFLLIRFRESAVITQSATLFSGTSTRAHTHLSKKTRLEVWVSTQASITRHPIQAPDSEGPLRKINRYLQQSITGFLWELIRKANTLRKLLFPFYLPQSSDLSISIGMGVRKMNKKAKLCEFKTTCVNPLTLQCCFYIVELLFFYEKQCNQSCWGENCADTEHRAETKIFTFTG